MKYYGICYYPELYDEEMREQYLQEDIALMKKTGFNVVRIAEFTWCLMEPEEGRYEFDWLEHYIDELGKNGIYSVLCTPTAAPPVWMAKKYPEICYLDNYGQKRSYGGRHFKCNNNPVMREKSRLICEKLGERFGKNPYILGFQVDNELGQEGTAFCSCPVCQAKFRGWVREKYGTVENLNQCWKTLNWGQTYPSFDEVEAPRLGRHQTPNDVFGFLGTDSPSLRLDWRRFVSDSVIEYYEMQRETLKKYTDKPVTNNTTHLCTNKVEWAKLLKNSEVTGVDHYPGARSENKDQSSFIYSHARGIRNSSFWLLETLCGGGQGNWAYQGMAMQTPGTFRENVAYAYASGADVITLFKYAVFAGGFEQLGSAFLDIDRVPRRRAEEFRLASEDMKKYMDIVEKTEIRADVAIVFNFDSLWDAEIKPIHKDFVYEDYLHELYYSLIRLGINVDVIDDEKPLDGYKLVILPFGMVMPDAFGEKVRKFTEAGGTFAATCVSFAKDPYANGVMGSALPIGMEDFFGMRVGEVEPVFPETVSKVAADGKVYTSKYWQEVLELTMGAEAEGAFADTFRQGECVISRHSYGKGTAIYMGTVFENAEMTDYVAGLLNRLGIRRAPVDLSDHGIDVVTRTDGEKNWYFVFNSRPYSVSVRLDGTFNDRMSGQMVSGTVEIPAKQFMVLE